jgi:hypothetical protein
MESDALSHVRQLREDMLNEGLRASPTLPLRMVTALRAYIMDGVEPGSFLTSVICNDLRGSIFSADGDNRTRIEQFVRLFNDYAPGPCWGSKDRMTRWMEMLRAEGE